MLARLVLVLERDIQSDEKITKVIDKLSHQGTLQGCIVMFVLSLVLVKGGFNLDSAEGCT
jgi:hypothetical protein